MTEKEFIEKLQRNRKEIVDYVRDKAPRAVGVKAVGFYKENYRRGGYLNKGFHAWPVTRRQMEPAAGVAGKYSPLLSKRNRLFSAIRYEYRPGRATILNDTPYAAIHNEGGEVHPRVTKEMRRYFWAMYYKKGGAKNPAADKYKWLALTRKERLNTRIPQRKFLYESAELDKEIRAFIKEGIRNIILQ